MERTSRPRNTSILIGIGLVLVGLMAGILVMLFIVDVRPAPSRTPQVVERVELGRQEPVRPVRVPEEESTATGTPADLLTLNRLFKEVAQHVTPAVVYIEVEGPPMRDMPRDWFHQFEDNEELNPRFFRDMPRQSVGSGVIISNEGYIVTNHHVVDRASRIQVTLADKRQYKAKVVGIDPSTDIAVIKVDPRDEVLPVAALGSSDELEVGEWVLAVGNPFRLTSTVTAGIVSALGRQVNIIDDPLRIEDFIQTDAAINPGNSGGALVNMRGELVGISTAIATESGSYEGYGFAVPSSLMERVVRDLIAYGEVQRGILGVKIRNIDAALAQRLGLGEIGGVYLDEVTFGGAAYQAGLRDGDVVLSIDGKGVNAPNELQSFIARHRPGDSVYVEYLREGRRKELQVRLSRKEDPAYSGWFAQQEEAEPQPDARRAPGPTNEVFQLEGWGVGLRDLSQRERDAFDTEVGVYLAYVENRSVADAAGLPRDVVVLRIGDESIESVEDAVRLLGIAAEESETVLFRVKRRDGINAFYDVDVPTAR